MVDCALREKLPILVDRSIGVAMKGKILAMDAITLGEFMERKISRPDLESFAAGTMKIAADAVADAHLMIGHSRAIRRVIFQASCLLRHRVT